MSVELMVFSSQHAGTNISRHARSPTLDYTGNTQEHDPFLNYRGFSLPTLEG